MYQDLPGAVWLEDESTYQIPCNTKVNISMVFRSVRTPITYGEPQPNGISSLLSGVPYPIHPIDAVIADIGDNGTVSCYAAWEAKDNGREFLVCPS